jgi:hypothetical protein
LHHDGPFAETRARASSARLFENSQAAKSAGIDAPDWHTLGGDADKGEAIQKRAGGARRHRRHQPSAHRRTLFMIGRHVCPLWGRSRLNPFCPCGSGNRHEKHTSNNQDSTTVIHFEMASLAKCYL